MCSVTVGGICVCSCDIMILFPQNPRCLSFSPSGREVTQDHAQYALTYGMMLGKIQLQLLQVLLICKCIMQV